MKNSKLSTLLILIIFNQNALSSEVSLLMDMSLEELLQIEVVSKVSEKISDSPAIVSVYYPEQLQRFGLKSVDDFISFAMSVELNHSVSGFSPIQIRGLSDSYNQKLLYLIDGTPYWMPSHGDIATVAIPISAIARIEVIRGPASVLYGTNSSSGVINIVTKTNQSNQWSGQIDSEGGAVSNWAHSFNTVQSQVDLAMEIRVDSGYEAKTSNTLGQFDPSCFCFPPVDEGAFRKKNEYFSLFGKYTDEHLSFKFQHHEQSLSSINSGTLVSPSNLNTYGTLFSVNYQRNLDNSIVNLYSDWNRFYWKREITGLLAFVGLDGNGEVSFDNEGNGNYRWRNGISWEITSTNGISWTLGGEIEKRATENNKMRDEVNGTLLTQVTQPPLSLPFQIQNDGSILLIDEDTNNETAIFGQMNLVKEKWRLVAGLRYTDNEFSGSNTAPRLSFIYHFDRTDSLKLLYSEGFNSPTFRQISARNSFGIPQDVDVSAEVIKTFELAYSVTKNDNYYVINYFNTRAEGFIESTNAGVFNSPDIIVRSGLEYEFNSKIGDTTIIGGMTYLHQGNELIDDDPASLFSSKWLAKVGLNHQIGDHGIGVSLRVASDRANVSGYEILNANYHFIGDDLTFDINLSNLTDNLIYSPDVRGQNETMFQRFAGRSTSIGITYKY